MSVQQSSGTAPDPKAVRYESMTSGAASLGAVGSVLGLAIASTAAAPVIGFVAGAAAGLGLGYIVNRAWSRSPVVTHQKRYEAK